MDARANAEANGADKPAIAACQPHDTKGLHRLAAIASAGANILQNSGGPFAASVTGDRKTETASSETSSASGCSPQASAPSRSAREPAMDPRIASSMQELLTAAVELHQGGQLGAAAHLYQKVLAQEKDNAEALHLFGVLRHQQGDHARAVELIGQAVALRPNVPAFHANLAEAYRGLRQLERAAGCCRAALQLWPDYPEALCNLGLAV